MPLLQERTARRLLELRWRKFVNFSTPLFNIMLDAKLLKPRSLM